MAERFVNVRVDMENNAEEWWDALRRSHPDLAKLLERYDAARLPQGVLDKLARLPGWEGGPEYAPHPLLVEGAADAG